MAGGDSTDSFAAGCIAIRGIVARSEGMVGNDVQWGTMRAGTGAIAVCLFMETRQRFP